jgi:hypothetical protein
MIWAWDIDTALPDFAQRYHQAALDLGLLLRPIGRTLYCMPPYVLDDADIAHLGQAALAALNTTLQQEAELAAKKESMIGCFVTGTDTGVGKTLASCALLHALAGHHPRVVGMKAVAAGPIPTGRAAGSTKTRWPCALPPRWPCRQRWTTPCCCPTPCRRISRPGAQAWR